MPALVHQVTQENIKDAFSAQLTAEQRTAVQAISAQYHSLSASTQEDGSFGTVSITLKQLNDLLAYTALNATPILAALTDPTRLVADPYKVGGSTELQIKVPLPQRVLDSYTDHEIIRIVQTRLTTAVRQATKQMVDDVIYGHRKPLLVLAKA